MEVVFSPRLSTFHLQPAHACAFFPHDDEETLDIASHIPPEEMEQILGVAFMPTPTNFHLHPAYAYPHLLLQQQQRENMLYREKTPTKSTWTFPGNVLKLNTDGSSKGNPGPSSFGGLIRDCGGTWVCGYMGKMKGRSYSSLEAEIWSIYKGLCLVKEKNLSNLLIETDCEAALMFRVGELDDPLQSVVEDIGRIMLEQKCTLIHTRRDGNHSADFLAKLGGNQSEEYTVLEEPPAILIPYLLRDTEAAYEFEWNR